MLTCWSDRTNTDILHSDLPGVSSLAATAAVLQVPAAVAELFLTFFMMSSIPPNSYHQQSTMLNTTSRQLALLWPPDISPFRGGKISGSQGGIRPTGERRHCAPLYQPLSISSSHGGPYLKLQRRFSHMHVDLVGQLPASAEGFLYIFTIIDRTTRWLEAVPLKDMSASSCSAVFLSTLGLLFWRASNCNITQGHTVHVRHVAASVQAAGSATCYYFLLPSTGQWDGWTCPLTTQGRLTCS